jgi:UDP-N-acetylglucosamine acyltransferase
MNDHTQNAAWAGELNHAGVLIKSGAVVREGAVIHQGTYRQTTIGERTWILNRAYIAHDVCVGHDVTVSAGVSIGGHCEIGDWVNLGMNASIHQKTLISAGCMVGMGTPLARDLPPFVKAFGSPARINGVNVVGMRRLGISEREITKLQDAYLQGDLLLQKTSAQWHGLLHSAVTDWRNHEKRNPAKPNL